MDIAMMVLNMVKMVDRVVVLLLITLPILQVWLHNLVLHLEAMEITEVLVITQIMVVI